MGEEAQCEHLQEGPCRKGRELGRGQRNGGKIWWEDDMAATSASRASFILRTWFLSTLASSSAKAQHNSRGKGEN